MAKNILIVDDSPSDLMLVDALLRNRGYQTAVAACAREGIEKVMAGFFDLVIIDAVMPNQDGFSACQEIKQLKLEKLPKVIIYTGTIDAINPAKAKRVGADDFAIKTADSSHLLKAIRNTIDPKNVLIIEGNVATLELLRDLLQDEGFRVATARNGRDGVELARRENPDLVVIDGFLSDMDGFEACSLIRQAKFNIPPKIMMVTASIDAVDAVKARHLGCDDFAVITADCRKVIEAAQKLV